MSRAVRVRAFPRLAGAIALAGAAILPATASATSIPKLGSRTLRHGMRGPDVRDLQRELSQAGLRTRASGAFDAQTTRSVRSFERRYGLSVDGVANRGFVHTLAEVRRLDLAEVDNTSGSGGGGLGAPTTKTTTKTTPKKTPKKTGTTTTTTDPTSVLGGPVTTPVTQDGGSRNLGERILHKGMTGRDVRQLQSFLTLDGFPTTIDGQFGPRTRTSVVKFEAANGLTPNGVVTYSQSVVLRQDVSKAVTATGTPGETATLAGDGTVNAPVGAPQVVAQVIAAANSIIDTPYIYGGGHGSFKDTGYDCSGAVSFALHGGGLLTAPEDSTQLESYGQPGPGKWITIYADSSHAFVIIGGLAFDTAHYGPTLPSGGGPRWLAPADATANLSDGGSYVIRHPDGL